jgi:hypothetical protein
MELCLHANLQIIHLCFDLMAHTTKFSVPRVPKVFKIAIQSIVFSLEGRLLPRSITAPKANSKAGRLTVPLRLHDKDVTFLGDRKSTNH